MLKLNWFFLLLLSYSTSTLVAQEDLFDWVIPLDHKKKMFLYADVVTIPSVSDKIYLDNGNYTSVYNIRTEKFDTVSFKLGKRIYLTEDSLWMVNCFDSSFVLTNTITNKAKSYEFRRMDYLGNSMFEFVDIEADSLHLVNPNNEAYIVSKKRQGYGDGFISNIESYGVIESDVNKTIFYTLHGDEIFSIQGTNVLPYYGTETVFLNKSNFYENSIVNARGKTILHGGHELLGIWDPIIILNDGIIVNNDRGGKDFIDFEGNQLEKRVKYRTKMDHVKKIFDPNHLNKAGLYFEKSKIETEVKYDEIDIHPRGKMYGSKNYIEAKNNKGQIDYYDPEGRLIYTTGEYRFNNYLHDKYILVGEGGYCGIIDNQGKVVVPMKKVATIFNQCKGFSNGSKENAYFYLTNSKRHLFAYNDKGEEMLSLTDGSYTGRTRFLNENIVLGKKVENGDLHDGLVSLTTGEILIPFKYQWIFSNEHDDVDQHDYVITVDIKANKYSLFHIPSRKFVLENCTKIKFMINNYIFVKKQGQSGLIKI